MRMELQEIVLVLLFFNLSPTPCTCFYIEYFRRAPSSKLQISSSITLSCFSYEAIYGFDFLLSKDGHNLTRNGDFLDEEFGNRTDTRVNFHRIDSVHGVDLTIASISRSDSGTYTCGLYGRGYLLDERSVTINVLYYPSSRFPICSFKTSHVDNNVTLSCFSEAGNPPVSLIWTTTENNAVDIALTTTNTVTDMLTSEISLQYSQIRITDTYMCSVYSSEFSYMRNCTIQVKSTLRARADIRPSKFSAEVNGEADFDCVINSQNNTKPLRWLWITEPQIPRSRGFPVGSAFRIDPTLAEDNGAMISCYALFENYWLLANAELVVVFNHTESRNETVNNPRGTRADSNIGWIGAFVVMIVVCAAIAGIAIFFYRKVRQNETTKVSHQDISVRRVKSVVQPQVNQAIVNDTPNDEYQDLNVEQNTGQEYTDLNLLSAGKDLESNSGLGKDNRKMQKNEEELYDYAETNVYERPNEDSRVYGNI